MPSSQTPNYGLSQWVRSDKVLMEDFNADNAKIDAALKAGTDSRASLGAILAQKGNCQIVYGSYIGSGMAGESHPTTLTFDGKPVAVFLSPVNTRNSSPISAFFLRGSESVYSCPRELDSGNRITWTGNSVSWYNYSASTGYQLNAAYTEYLYAALLAADE